MGLDSAKFLEAVVDVFVFFLKMDHASNQSLNQFVIQGMPRATYETERCTMKITSFLQPRINIHTYILSLYLFI